MGVLVCLVALLALVVASHGLALISAVLVLAAYLVWKRKLARQQDAKDAALLRARLARNQTIEGMLGLTPKEFEESVADIMICLGYTEVEIPGGAGDEGADVRAVDPNGKTVVVQCKLYAQSHKVGSPEAQLLLGAKSHFHADRVILVTTSTFTAPATGYAATNGLELVDGHQLANWAHRALQIQAAESEPTVSTEKSQRESSWIDRVGQPLALVVIAVVLLGIGLSIHPSSPATANANNSQTIQGSRPSSSAPPAGSTPLSTTTTTTTTTAPLSESSTTTTADLSEATTTAESQSDQVQSDIAELSSDGSSVTSSTDGLSSDLSSLAEDVAQAKTDDAQAHTDAASTETADEVCGDASTVAGDVTTVEGDLTTIRGDQTTYQGSLDPITTDEATLNRDFATLENDEASLPSGDRGGLVTQADVNAALAQLSQTVATGQDIVTAALNTAQAGLSQAQSYAADAQSLCAG